MEFLLILIAFIEITSSYLWNTFDCIKYCPKSNCNVDIIVPYSNKYGEYCLKYLDDDICLKPKPFIHPHDLSTMPYPLHYLRDKRITSRFEL